MTVENQTTVAHELERSNREKERERETRTIVLTMLSIYLRAPAAHGCSLPLSPVLMKEDKAHEILALSKRRYICSRHLSFFSFSLSLSLSLCLSLSPTTLHIINPVSFQSLYEYVPAGITTGTRRVNSESLREF